VTVHHRDDLDAIQKQMREITGCTIIIYDQTCATEKRRRRKRGTLVDPAKRSSSTSWSARAAAIARAIELPERRAGRDRVRRKRRINQNSCNKDYSCVKGFCPSFITVEGGQLKGKKKDATRPNPFTLPPLPEPALPLAEVPWGIVVAGVGGTGVITIGQLLGMAAHLEGKGVVTQDAAGLAQKGGATWSHIQIANRQGAILTTKVGTAEATW